MKIPFISQAYSGRSLNFETSRSINLFPEVSADPSHSKAVAALYGTVGAESWSSIGTDPIRGMRSVNNVLYVVAGSGLYSISGANRIVSLTLGTLRTSSGRVLMADNGVAATGVGGNQLMIVDGVDGYIYNIATHTFSQVLNVQPEQATAIAIGGAPTTQIVSVPAPDPVPIFSTITSTIVTDTTGTGAVVHPNLGYPLAVGDIAYSNVTVYSHAGVVVSVVASPGGKDAGPLHCPIYVADPHTSLIPVLTIEDPTGTGASGGATRYKVTSSSTPEAKAGNWYIFNVYIDVPGTGYTNPTASLLYETYDVVTGVLIQKTISGIPLQLNHLEQSVLGFTVLNGGVGYSPTPTVTITGADNTGAPLVVTATAVVAPVYSPVNTLRITYPGAGYTAPPAATLFGSSSQGTPVTAVLRSTVSGGKVTALSFVNQSDSVALYGTNPTVTIDPASGSSFPSSPTSLAFLDGYFITASRTMSVHVSNLYDGTSWNPLAVAAASATTDVVQALANSHQQLWVIKQQSSEVWYDSGTATFEGSPFVRVQGAVVDFGTPAPNSVTAANNSLFFLATQKTDGGPVFVGVVSLNGYTPVIISPASITYKMSLWSDMANAFAFSYSEGGHTFVAFTSPGDNQTFVYDPTTSFWHEWSSYKDSPYIPGRHFSNCYARHKGMHLVGDYASGSICRLTYALGTEMGRPIVCQRIAPIIADADEGERVFISRLIIDAEMGGGGVGTDSQATIAISGDSGHTWSSEYPAASAGGVGEYAARLVWRRLGGARNRVIRLSASAPGPRVFMAAIVEGGS